MQAATAPSRPMEFKRRRRRRRRQRRRKEPKAAAVVDADDARRIHDVTDDLLWRILLHLDSPLWLLRAACACKRWRRVVVGGDGGRAFLRLASSLHPPAVVGHYHGLIAGGHRFVPSSPRAPIDRRLFSLDFIPCREWDRVAGTTPVKNWKVADCHGGLVLLRDRHAGFLSDLVVFEPLTRRCHGIHRPPDPRRPPGAADGGHHFANVFLLDGDGDNGNTTTSISNFRVLYRAVHDDGRVSHLYLFSMAAAAGGGGGGGGDWRLLRRRRRRSEPDDDGRYRDGVGRVAGRVDGSLYLGAGNGVVTVLDNAKLEFSKVDLPIDVEQQTGSAISVRSTFAVVHSAAAGPGPGPDPASPPPPPPAACIVHVHGEKLELFRQVRAGRRGGDEWVLAHSISKLSRATRGLRGYPAEEEGVRWLAMEVVAGGPGYAVLSVWVSDRGVAWQFCFNVETMELLMVSNDAANAYRGTSLTSAST